MKKEKKEEEEKKNKLQMVMVGFDLGTYGLRNPRLTTELPKLNTNLYVQNMYLYSIWRLGPYDLRPVQSQNSNFDLKNLTKYIIKVVNVSKSQYYEFRHNIMN